jgi:uncharacterized protein
LPNCPGNSPVPLTFRNVTLMPTGFGKTAGAAVLIGLSLVLIMQGQPSAQDRWNSIAAREDIKLAQRDVYVHPAEVVELEKDPTLYVRILDVRSESDYNLFHLGGSERVVPESLADAGRIRQWLAAPENTVFFVVANGEVDATRAWKLLRASGLLNLYIIEGGINRWLTLYPPGPCVAERVEGGGDTRFERLAYWFHVAVGERIHSAHPYSIQTEPYSICSGESGQGNGADGNGHNPAAAPRYDFVRKVKLQRKVAVKGGCG